MTLAPYPALGPAVARLRRSTDRHAHGTAVLDAIRALQARELARAVPDAPVRCASGTRHQDGVDILTAIRGQHAAALSRARCTERTPAEWAAAYGRAMAERQEAASKPVEKIDMAIGAEAPGYISAHISSPDLRGNQTRKSARSVNRPARHEAAGATPAAPPATDARPASVPPAIKPARQLAIKTARPATPPRPDTLPPAATVARTWMTGAVGVSFTL